MSIKVVYLASNVTLPHSPDRRSDAYEHDQMMAALSPGFEDLGAEITDLAWDDPTVDWSDFDAVIIGTTWDYWDRQDEFLATLEKIESEVPLYNPSGLVRWNSHKGYLKDLEARGAVLIPTRWEPRLTEDRMTAAFDAFGCDELVIKRQIGAGADGQFRVQRGDPCPETSHPMMLQPFMPTILSEGELSLVFIGGRFCHALVKSAHAGDYRIQSTYGGVEDAYRPTVAELDTAAAILAALDEVPAYARVDMIRSASGDLLLMELELIEPFLYPLQGPDLGPMLSSFIIDKLNKV